MGVMVNNAGGDSAPWVKVLAEHLPDQYVFEYSDIADKSQIDYAVIWNHPHGELATYPNLKAVLILGAGTDHLDKDTQLPKVPYVRLIDPDVGNDMAQYVLYWVMHFQRHYERYREQTASRHWQGYEWTRSQDLRVTVLGSGRIGEYISRQLAANNFLSQAWNRSPRQIENVKSFTGQAGLEQVLMQSDVLVNCLPLNDHTRGFINHQKLSLLPEGACFINVSRGAVVDDTALLESIKSGQLAMAALDTFSQEPLPQESPYWALDNVFITPHMSGSTYAKSAAHVVADNIKRIQHGDAPFPIHFPPERCYG